MCTNKKVYEQQESVWTLLSSIISVQSTAIESTSDRQVTETMTVQD